MSDLKLSSGKSLTLPHVNSSHTALRRMPKDSIGSYAAQRWKGKRERRMSNVPTRAEIGWHLDEQHEQITASLATFRVEPFAAG